MNATTCQFCKAELKGRGDKKFCDDQCRTAYNNRLKADVSHMRNVNNILRKNRLIMKELVPEPEGKIRVTEQKLTDKGFNFYYHTHVYHTQTGNAYHFCYEYGYQKLESGFYLLVQKNLDK